MHDISLTSDRSPASGGRMLPEALENEAMERKNDGKQIWEKLREKRRKRKSERPGENQASASSEKLAAGVSGTAAAAGRDGATGTAGTVLVAVLFGAAAVFAVAKGIPLKQITSNFQYDVLVILITMELFTGLVAETGIMQRLALKLAVFSGGEKRRCLVLFSLLMFFVSAFLNNITAVMMVLPVIFVLFRALQLDRRYVGIFFSCLLVMSNTGGASSPIGDFPAVIIMTSGITTFTDYLFRAFPVFLLTSVLVAAVWRTAVKRESGGEASRTLAVEFLQSRYKYTKVRKDTLIVLGVIFLAMFLAWSFVPQETVPPEVIALLGYVTAAAVAAKKGIDVKQIIDMKSVLTIASFLFLAAVVSASGYLSTAAQYLQSVIGDQKILLLVLMLMTSVISGLFSAGPAAAAMMPIIVDLCSTSFAAQTHWVAVAYAASICAGSSMFLWSATAGFILSGKIDEAQLEENGTGKICRWKIPDYLKFGLVNYAIQMSVAVAAVLIIF